MVQTTAFVRCANHVDGYKGTYCRLIEPTSQQGKEDMFLAGKNRYTANQDDFGKIPGEPMAYWVSEKILDSFMKKPMQSFADLRQGLITGDNERFLNDHGLNVILIAFTTW